MKLSAKLTLASCVAAVGACGMLAFLSSDDERRDFVRGTSKRSELPRDVLVVDVEVDDEYEDTDDESDRVGSQQHSMRLMQVAPVPETVARAVVTSGASKSVHSPAVNPEASFAPRQEVPLVSVTVNKSKGNRGPENEEDDKEEAPERLLQVSEGHSTTSNNAVEVYA